MGAWDAKRPAHLFIFDLILLVELSKADLRRPDVGALTSTVGS
jgi:hypothetical protein